MVVVEYLYGATETESHYSPGSHLNKCLYGVNAAGISMKPIYKYDWMLTRWFRNASHDGASTISSAIPKSFSLLLACLVTLVYIFLLLSHLQSAMLYVPSVPSCSGGSIFLFICMIHGLFLCWTVEAVP